MSYSQFVGSYFKSSIYFFLGLVLIFITAWLIQNAILFSWDNDILLHETQKMLNGGTYAKDFFETSPSMILYLYIPPLLFAKAFSLPLFIVFRVYVFGLTILSLWFCHNLLNEIFLRQDRFFNNLFLLCIAAVYLILPEVELGQREHLFLMFSLPYIFLLALRLKNKPVNTAMAIFIGLLAGAGFAIKPFFVLTPFMLEIYAAIHARSLTRWLRSEIAAIGIVQIAYAIISLTMHSDYYHIVVPFAMRLYYRGPTSAWGEIIFHPLTIFIAATTLFYVIQYNLLARYKLLANILLIAFLSQLLIFILQRHIFYYHLVPVLAMSFLLQILLFYSLAKTPLGRARGFLLVLLAAGYTAYTCHEMKFAELFFFFSPQILWIYFAVAFLLLSFLLQTNKSFYKCVLPVVLVITFGCLFNSFVLRVVPPTNFLENNLLIVSVVLSLMLFTLLINSGKSTALIIVTLFIFTFMYPCFTCYAVYTKAVVYKNATKPLVAYLKTHMQNQTVYFFGSGSRFAFPLVDYAGTTSVSRFPFFWMMPGLINKSILMPTDANYIKDRNFLIGMVTEDLNTQKPDYVLIDVSKIKPCVQEKFEYLPYFMADEKFKDAWGHYRYLTTVNGETTFALNTYHLAVYERVRSPNNL